jgi:hypothetical protein
VLVCLAAAGLLQSATAAAGVLVARAAPTVLC